MDTATLTYTGRRIGRNGKLIYTYKHEGETLTFSKALLPATVGAHIEVNVIEADDKGTPVKINNAKYGEGRTVAGLEMEAALDAAAIGADEARKRATRTDPLLEALAPIREAYMASTPVERAALITKVVAKITSYGA